jgi:hypothetical protein
MNKLYATFFVFISLMSCNSKSVQDLPLEIIGYETTVFKGGNFNEARFIGIFDGNSGKLKFSFGEFGEERKKIESYVKSLGLIIFGSFNNEFYIQDKVSSPIINKYDGSGNLKNSYEIWSYFLSYHLDPNQGSFEEGHAFNDHNYGMVVAHPNRVISVGVKFKDKSKNILNRYGILFVEDLENGVSYSSPIDPFQKVLWVNDLEIYLVRNPPITEDMILVKLKYKLGESVED